MTSLTIGHVGGDDAHEWAEVYCAGFGMPSGPLVDLFAAMVSTPGFHPLAAWDGGRIVSAGNLHIQDGRGAMCGVATLPEARSRGAQSALFERRVTIAREECVRVLSAETWAEREPADHNPSLHNMLRAGFRPVYKRTNWVWRAS